MSYPKRNERVCLFFESIGVDPHTVAENGVNQAGFEVFATDADGKQVIERDYVVRKFIPWERPEQYEAFLYASRRDSEAYFQDHQNAQWVDCECCGVSRRVE